MITVLTGENSFEVERELRRIEEAHDEVEKVEGAALSSDQLPELLSGSTLFVQYRLIVIRNLSSNKVIWPTFGDWLNHISDETSLVLVESKLDKRSKTYKTLRKLASVKEFPAWSERDRSKAEAWVQQMAQTLKISWTSQLSRLLVARVGVNQWRLYHALEKLSLVDVVNREVIETVIEPSPTENVFNLFEAALQGKTLRIQQMMAVFQISQDPYQLFGLLSGQVMQLATLCTTSQPIGVIAKDLGFNPYPLEKLAPYARKGVPIQKIVQDFVQADILLKTSSVDVWLVIEQALVKVASYR